MDVNGTRFHLALTEAEWLPPADTAAGAAARAAFEYGDGTLQLRRLPPRLPATDLAAAVPQLGRGAAADRYGNVYWIAPTGDEVRFLGADWSVSQRFWPPREVHGCAAPAPDRGDFAPALAPAPAVVDLAGLTVTSDHYLVVGTRAPAGLLIFDLYGGGAPLASPWPDTIPFVPADLAAAPDGGVWVLDRVHHALWRLDRTLRVVPAVAPPVPDPVFTPAAGTGAADPSCALDPLGPDAALGLAGAVDPVAIEALPDGSVLVLDNDPSTDHSVVRRYRAGLPAGVRALDHDLVEEFDGGGLLALRLRGRDIVVVPDGAAGAGASASGTLYVAALDDRQVFSYELTATADDVELELVSRLYPLRAVAEHGLVRSGERVRYGFADRWLPLAEFPEARYVTRGQMELPIQGAFDGREPGCVWHRLLVDGAIPGDAELTVESRAADDPALLPVTPWQREPRAYRRGDGAELPFYRFAAGTTGRCGGTWELLFQHARGRYLQLRLTLQGRGRTTPRLQALRVYYPRFSYLQRYLPAVYRDDPGSAGFLDRYLANVEGIFTAVEGRVADAQVLFDTRVTPAAYLPWLASWLGVGLDAAWSERTARLFLAHAAQMFATRGSPCGVVRAVRLALEPCVEESLFDDGGCSRAAFGVRVVERYQLRHAPGVVFGDPTELLGPGSTTEASDWRPVQGAEPLHRQFRRYLASRYPTIASLDDAWSATFTGFDDPALRLSALRPAGAPGRDWQTFIDALLGFTYAAPTDDDEPLFREYLARRYRQVADLNRAWGLDGPAALASFGELKSRLWDAVLRSDLPPDGPPLRDWIAFVSQVLPTARNAHRFTLLIPVGLADTPADQIRKRDLADRIVRLEKPAHTQHEVRLYWGAFRVGEARVGLETLVAFGSRSAALMLGRDLLGASHLGFGDAERMPDRLVLAGGAPACPAPSATCLRN